MKILLDKALRFWYIKNMKIIIPYEGNEERTAWPKWMHGLRAIPCDDGALVEVNDMEDLKENTGQRNEIFVWYMLDNDRLLFGRINRPAKRKLFKDEFKVREKKKAISADS